MKANILQNDAYRYDPYHLPESFPFLFDPPRNDSSDTDTFIFHNCTEILLCRKPTQINIDNRVYHIVPGDVCIIAPFQMHMPVSRDDDSCYCLVLDHRAILQDFFTETYSFQKLIEQLIKRRNNVLDACRIPNTSLLIRKLVDHILTRPEYDHYTVQGILLVFWIEMSRALGLTSDDYDMMFKRRELVDIHPALVYIHEYYQQEISTEKLAQLCSMSPSQFRVTFKKRLHQTPHEYINNMRLDCSCRLLLETDLNILPISLSCGFNSLSSYNRCFKARYGTSPTQWKREH